MTPFITPGSSKPRGQASQPSQVITKIRVRILTHKQLISKDLKINYFDLNRVRTLKSLGLQEKEIIYMFFRRKPQLFVSKTACPTKSVQKNAVIEYANPSFLAKQGFVCF